MGRNDPETLNVPDTLMDEAINLIKTGISQKLDSAKHMIDYDKEIAAGIYVYALEELGKLEVLKDAVKTGNQYTVIYRDKFLCHGVKFSKAFDCVKKFNHPECMYLTKGFSPFSFSNDSFRLALLAKTKARLGIFYIDFDYDKPTITATKIKEIPPVDEGMLKRAIDGLEDVIKKWP
jgi:hypothetical protein